MIPYHIFHFVYLSSLLKEKHKKFYNDLTILLDELKIHWKLLYDTKDIWCRDYMPVQINPKKFVQFSYNPDYLEGYEYLKTEQDKVCSSISIKPVKSNLIIDGGNIIKSKTKVICTDKIYSENKKNYSELEIRKELRQLLQVEEIIIIPQEPCDIIGHSDGMVKFIDDNTVLLNDYSQIIPSFHRELMKIFSEHNLKVELMPYKIFQTVNEDKIPSAKGNYINFLQIGEIIILPEYRMKEDKEALQKVSELFPYYTIRTIDCNSIAKEGGVLNCITWDIMN